MGNFDLKLIGGSVLVTEMEKKSEVQFHSLINLSPEELQKALAKTLPMSAPKPADECDSGFTNLKTMLEGLLDQFSRHEDQLSRRMNKINERLQTLESCWSR